MGAYPVDVVIRDRDEEAMVVLSDGSRVPLSVWMRRRLEDFAEPPPLDRVGAKIW